MAALAHFGVGLAAKRVAPSVPRGVLMLGVWLLDLLWGLFFLVGLEHLPEAGRASPWSHGLFMAVVWSLLAASAAFLVRHRWQAGAFIGLLVFSHWAVDFISQPMTHQFPGSVGPPLRFEGSPTVGLGLYRTALGQSIGEYGTLAVGTALYVLAVLKIRRARAASRAGPA